MTKFKSSGVLYSIANALHGLRLAFFSQRNFVLECLISVVGIVLSFIFGFSATDTCILILTCMFVLGSELFNSVIEFTLDAVYKNHYSKLVEMAKDISAGMVFLSVIMGGLIGIILFGSNIIKKFGL